MTQSRFKLNVVLCLVNPTLTNVALNRGMVSEKRHGIYTSQCLSRA